MISMKMKINKGGHIGERGGNDSGQLIVVSYELIQFRQGADLRSPVS
jgi:hypothetical protein